MQTNTLKRGVISGTVALALVGTILTTPVAQAATQADLLAQIQSLLAQVATLQTQLGGTTTNTTSCTVPQANLSLGQGGNEVNQLQTFLIGRNYSIPAGATSYFGGQTQQALARFQSDQGISPASGNFGPLTRARIQSLCAVSVTPTPVPTPTPTPAPTPAPTETLSGEASIDRFSVSDGNDTDLEEGDANKEVMEVAFKITDGDIKMNRIDIGFTPDAANNEDSPWKTFDTISVWNGSKKVAEIDASRKQNWKEDSPTTGDYMLRLSGLSTIIKENKEVTLTVKATVAKSVKGTNDGEIWNLFIPTNGLRALDADNAIVYAGDTADAVTINLDAAGATDELITRRSDADLDATSLQVKDDARSGFTKVFAFDIDTDDSHSDIEIRRLPIRFDFSTSTLSTFVRDVRIIADGKTYTRQTLTDGISGTSTFTFNSNEFVIDAGDRITVTVEVDFKALPAQFEGATVTGHVDASTIKADGADTLVGTQLASKVSGETHSLYTKGSVVSQSNTTAVVTSSNGASNDYVTFGVTATISPFGQDVYIPTDGSGMTYKLTDALGNDIAASGTPVISSSAKETGNYFRITEGDKATISLDVTYQPGVQNITARLQLISINFSDAAQSPTQSWLAQPASQYRTATKTIVD